MEIKDGMVKGTLRVLGKLKAKNIVTDSITVNGGSLGGGMTSLTFNNGSGSFDAYTSTTIGLSSNNVQEYRLISLTFLDNKDRAYNVIVDLTMLIAVGSVRVAFRGSEELIFTNTGTDVTVKSTIDDYYIINGTAYK